MANQMDFENAVRNLSFEVGRTQALTKDAVQFTQNVESERRCGNCGHFMQSATGEGSCQIVSGAIAETDGCSVFVGRARAA